MPESLQSTYSQILHELHSSDNWPILERTLALVSYGARPVTIREVAEFAILEDEMTTIQSEERLEDFGDILSLISSLIDVQDGHLTLAHKSVQEYLNAEPEFGVSWWLKDSILYEGADLYIAKRCLQYLSFPQRPACEFKEYRDVKDPNAKHLARLLSDYPLLDYAASRWAYHVRSEEVRNMVAKKMQNTLPLTAEPNLWKAWLLLQRADIWETRVQLARLLCEVSIRSATEPGWACNLWKVRQAYRFTIDARKVGHLNEKLSPKDHQGEGSSSSQILNEIRKTARKQSQNQWMILTTGGKSLYNLAVILLEVALQTNLYSDLDLILSNISSAKDLKGHLKDMLALSKYAETIMGKQYSAVVNECLSIVKPATTTDEFRRANILESQDDAMEKFHAPLQSMLKSGFRASRGPVTARRRSKVQPTSSASSHAYTSASTTGYGRSGTSASVYEYTATSTSSHGRTAMSATNHGYSAMSNLGYRKPMGPNTTDVVAMSEPLPPIPKPYSEGLPVLPGIGSAELPTMASLSSQSELPPPAPVLPSWPSESEPPPPAPALPSWSSKSEPPPKFPQLHYVHETKQGTSTTQNTISSNLSTVVEIPEKSLKRLEGLLLEWMRQVETGEDATIAMEEYLASDLRDRQKNKGGPFELPADEKKEGVARRNENTAVADQSSKYSYGSPSERKGRKGMKLPSLSGKTMEELAFELMRHIRREEDSMTLMMGFMPNDERNRWKNEGGPFELASGIDENDSGKGVDAAALMRQIRREEAAALPKTTSRDDQTM